MWCISYRHSNFHHITLNLNVSEDGWSLQSHPLVHVFRFSPLIISWYFRITSGCYEDIMFYLYLMECWKHSAIVDCVAPCLLTGVTGQLLTGTMFVACRYYQTIVDLNLVLSCEQPCSNSTPTNNIRICISTLPPLNRMPLLYTIFQIGSSYHSVAMLDFSRKQLSLHFLVH